MNTNAKWIKAVDGISELCPEFRRSYKAKKTIASAEACVTALGMYNLYINGKKWGITSLPPDTPLTRRAYSSRDTTSQSISKRKMR